MEQTPIILENSTFRLTLTAGGAAQSLLLKSNGAECLANADTPFFSLTEERPYNNEIKLALPTAKTTFAANRLRVEDGNLIVGFEHIDFEAVIRAEITDRYMVFSLVEFLVKPDSFGIGVVPMLPPVLELRLAQLAVSPRAHFGEWLNVMWDDTVAVNVLAACPYVKIGAEKRRDHNLLFGDVVRDVRLKNAGVALIVSEPARLLDAIEALEIDRDLPRGVESRRSAAINRSYYWVNDITPSNADAYIAAAQKAGIKHMLIYYTAILHSPNGYGQLGNYDDYNPAFPNGKADLVKLLDKLKAAGITPGLHALHSHIGLKSHYLTPVADHRMHLTRHFSLAQPCSAEDTTIYVEEDPEGVPQYEKMRVLQFMGELIQYESYSTERPYCFTGCKRGYNDTIPKAHAVGTIGGVLDVSEFSAASAYINQETGLQDEIAQKIAEIYDAGFAFLYFDGSEGVNPPFDIYVGLAQWRVYERLTQKPLFCEGAAKSHFSWHMLSGGNAFDVFPSSTFKKMIVQHPFKEAAQMKNDFTRVNFGWWELAADQRADIVEYGTAVAAACDCPGAMIAPLRKLEQLPRADDILETLRRWETARADGFITDAIKAELQHTEREHTLLVNGRGAFELATWEQVTAAVGGDPAVTVFLMDYKDAVCAVCWHNKGEGHLSLDLGDGPVRYREDVDGADVAVEQNGGRTILPVGKKRYLFSDLTKEQLAAAFVRAELI